MLMFICQALCYLSGKFVCSITSGVISIYVQNSPSDHGGHVIDIENRRGPNNDPCGTPLVTVNQSDATPLITILCCLCEGKYMYQFKKISLMPTYQICKMISNASVKANTAATTFPLSTAGLQSSCSKHFFDLALTLQILKWGQDNYIELVKVHTYMYACQCRRRKQFHLNPRYVHETKILLLSNRTYYILTLSLLNFTKRIQKPHLHQHKLVSNQFSLNWFSQTTSIMWFT